MVELMTTPATMPPLLRLHDDQWERLREHVPEERIPEHRPGRTPIPTRAVLEAVLWILNTGTQWHLRPQWDPNYKTVHRRVQPWCERAVLRDMLPQLANTWREEGVLDERASFIDTTCASAKGEATTSGKPAVVKASRAWRLWIALGCRSP